MKLLKNTLFFLFCSVSHLVFGTKIDTVSTYSQSMGKEIKAVIITPDKYSKLNKALPVVYLLHGYSGNYSDWMKNVPEIENYSDRFGIIIVCPDGNFASWYLDSPEIPEVKYETYIASELVNFIDKRYNTIKNRNGRAITGLSMGGHGALYLAFRHQNIFGQAGSLSGGVDLRPFPENWGIPDLLGTYAEYPERWNQNSVINLTYLLKPNSLHLIISCGTEDFFYGVNQNLHKKLSNNNIPHTFISAPGGHTWGFWSNHINYQMHFFNQYFVNHNL